MFLDWLASAVVLTSLQPFSLDWITESPQQQFEYGSPRIIRLPPEFRCTIEAPKCLTFIEPLPKDIRPDQVTIFTGGDSLARRREGFAKLSAETVIAFAKHHGYNLVFLDQLDYNKNIVHKGVKYSPQWHRVFALDSIRRRFPSTLYFLWMDDDIVVPFPETDMLNHWINKMEAKPSWQMMYVREWGRHYLNSGMILFKNHHFAFDLYWEVLEIGLEDNNALALYGLWEQDALVKHIQRNPDLIKEKIRLIPNRDGVYTFNCFYRDVQEDLPGAQYEFGDAFVHFLGANSTQRMEWIPRVLDETKKWRDKVLDGCIYPFGIEVQNPVSETAFGNLERRPLIFEI